MGHRADTILALKSICRDIEERDEQIKGFKLPPAISTSTLEADLAYRPPQSHRVSSVEVSDSHAKKTKTFSGKCFNCDEVGHRRTQCPKPKRFFFVLGVRKKGFVAPTVLIVRETGSRVNEGSHFARGLVHECDQIRP